MSAGWSRSRKSSPSGSQPKVDASVTEHLRAWLGRNQQLEPGADGDAGEGARAERKGHQAASGADRCEERGDHDAARAACEEILAGGRKRSPPCASSSSRSRQNIQEDQRIIVVDAGGFVLGLVVDHVNEVLNVPKKLVDPPPRITSDGGMELSGVAKLDDGSRLIMLLDVANLMRDQKLREVQNSARRRVEAEEVRRNAQTDAGARN